jgi:hypothetical protein
VNEQKLSEIETAINSNTNRFTDETSLIRLRSQGKLVYKLSIFYKYLYLLEREDAFASSSVSRSHNFFTAVNSGLWMSNFRRSFCSFYDYTSAWVVKLFVTPLMTIVDLAKSIFDLSENNEFSTGTNKHTYVQFKLYELENHEPLSELSCIMRDVSELLAPDSEV